jgi:hypothetical protein
MSEGEHGPTEEAEEEHGPTEEAEEEHGPTEDAEGEHDPNGEAEGGTAKRRMVVRWGRAHFEEIKPGDPDYVEDAAADGDSEPDGDQPPPEPGTEQDGRNRRRGGERRLDVARRQRRLKIALVFLLAMDVVMLVQRFTDWGDPTLLSEVPPSILGTWVTEDPVYSGRAFAISAEVFELRLSEEGNYRFDIRSIRGVETENSWRFDITYASPEEGDQEHVFFLYADGTARLINPSDIVWTRLPSG